MGSPLVWSKRFGWCAGLVLAVTVGRPRFYDDATPAPHSWNVTWVQKTLEHLMTIVK